MLIVSVRIRDFRCYAAAEATLGEGLTVVTGPNGAGKTNLLEALYFGCTARSFRTSADRDLVRFGRGLTRVEVTARSATGEHHLSVGLEPGSPRRITVDGAAVERLVDSPERPLVAVFCPDRLGLVKGAPSVRRGHLDQVVAALWPGRAATRHAYLRALGQRNALLARVRSGVASAQSLGAWEAELAHHGSALMADRAAAVGELAQPFAACAGRLGLPGEVTLAHRPRSRAASAEELAGELAARRRADIERGFTDHGPHRDELALLHDGRELRAFGSQGQQRLALLALLLAERAAIGGRRQVAPVMLLDDVTSELDLERRRRLVAMLDAGGQSVITATDPGHVPGADSAARLVVRDGAVLGEAPSVRRVGSA